MASALPAKLKLPTIQPFAVRAAQLETVEPVIAHWCRYYIVQTIITQGLHEADDECREYTSQIMDKLEETKSKGPSNELMLPNDAAQAYVEKFALDTFARADNAIHSDRASRQTVETFQAAINFIELLTVFGPLDPDMHSKIKYAKYHALRIVKAMRAGEDPNASNPKDEIPTVDEPSAGPADGLADSAAPYKSPTVESAPESMHPSRAASTLNSVPLAAAPPSGLQTPSNLQQSTTTIDQSGVSPIEAPTNDMQSKQTGYFPPPSGFESGAGVPPSPEKAPESFYAPAPSHPAPPPLQGHIQPPTAMPQSQSQSQPRSQPLVSPLPQHQPVPSAAVQTSSKAYHADDEAITSAQKHAKWAISALNFEDVNTAVKELRIALQALGAS